jgi:D-cysteine desulfhydrase family pyridoxal phosphate-dependent enzyme
MPTFPDRLPLAHLPTPVHPLSRLSQALGGPTVWVKRDDLTGLAGGGNKARKLEFLAFDALAQAADMLITVGGPQSNHARQTAAVAARLGLGCKLVLGGAAPQGAAPSGNLLLDQLLGAEVVWAGDRPRAEVLEAVAAQARAAGHRPYVVPLGGSTPLGALGYAYAMLELQRQLPSLGVGAADAWPFDWIVFASGSGGTHAGLVLGAFLAGFTGRVLGISVDGSPDTQPAHVAGLATEAAGRLGLDYAFKATDIAVNGDYVGQGYAKLGPPEHEAIHLLARSEGLLVDPVYTGRAAAGLIDLIRRGAIRNNENVLFWHTGGTPALFAYADQLV